METETVVKINELHSSRLEEDDTVQCPNCDVKIKRCDMAEHYKLELERLKQQQILTNEANDVAAASSNSHTGTNGVRQTRQSKSGGGAGGEDLSRRQPLSVFKRVQRNRQTRLKQRTRKRPTLSASSSTPTEAICPICNKIFPQSEIQVHANKCLRHSENNSSEDDSDENGEPEWHRQKRVRLEYTTMGHLVKYKPNQLVGENDEDEDLNVDEDDTQIYGPAQYSETDVIPLASTAADGNVMYMRRLISSGDKKSHSNDADDANKASGSRKRNSSRSRSSSPCCSSQLKLANQIAKSVKTEVTNNGNNDSDKDIASENVIASTSRMLLDKTQPKSIQYYEEVVESLKSKLKLYESEIQSKYKCLICLDDYKNPAISVSCWHVYCEQCWLRTLGARKLCPQCNSITTTKDLRRIYL